MYRSLMNKLMISKIVLTYFKTINDCLFKYAEKYDWIYSGRKPQFA